MKDTLGYCILVLKNATFIPDLGFDRWLESEAIRKA